MNLSFRQLLTVFLAAALIFSPLQSAFAGPNMAAPVKGQELVVNHVDHSQMTSMTMSSSQDMSKMAAMADCHCDQCDTGNCSGTQCLSSHCSACTTGLLPTFFSTSDNFMQPLLALPDVAHLQSLSETLFRPPRA
ncbi:MAG: hypothetical protein ACWA44_11140 [Thiotrichales bacterium]